METPTIPQFQSGRLGRFPHPPMLLDKMDKFRRLSWLPAFGSTTILTAAMVSLLGAAVFSLKAGAIKMADESALPAHPLASTAGSLSDRTQPHTTAFLAGMTDFGNYLNYVVLTLRPTDNLGRVSRTVYQVDGSKAHLYRRPFTVSGNGVHKIAFHSVDFAGRAEATQWSAFRITGSTTIRVVAPHNPATLHTVVTFIATVAPGDVGTPTGTVTFTDGPTILGAAPVADGKAAFSTSALATGVHPIRASYSGDASFAGSTTLTLFETVAKDASTESAAASSRRHSIGQ